MPVKKNVGSKRGKNATAKVETLMPESEGIAEAASELKVLGKDVLDSTFVISKDVDDDVGNDVAKIAAIDNRNGVVEVGNGDAQNSLVEIEEEMDETEEVKPILKKKGRAKATAKKSDNTNEPGKLEFSADDDQENDEPGSSPKRPHDESSNEETAAEEPLTKRGREEGAKKARPVSKKTRRTKNEPLPVANVDDESVELESSPEEAATKFMTKNSVRARKGLKAKEEEGKEEREEDEDEVSEKKAIAAKKKGRPATKAESPETDNSKNSVEDVGVAQTKTTKKRATKEKTAVPQTSTRPTRTRKPVSYGETADEAEDTTGNKKPRKAAPKKATLTAKNATKAGTGTKKRGRVAVRASDEAEKEE